MTECSRARTTKTWTQRGVHPTADRRRLSQTVIVLGQKLPSSGSFFEPPSTTHTHTHHEHATDSFTSIANARFHSSGAVLLACLVAARRGTFLPNLLWRLQDERVENRSHIQTFPAPDLGDYVELRGEERQIVYEILKGLVTFWITARDY